MVQSYVVVIYFPRGRVIADSHTSLSDRGRRQAQLKLKQRRRFAGCHMSGQVQVDNSDVEGKVHIGMSYWYEPTNKFIRMVFIFDRGRIQRED